MPKTYIIGHRKPDTDAVVSAMALEFLYKQKECFGYENPEAVIVDPLNPETTFLFEKFGVEAPRIISAKDIMPEDRIVLVDHNEADQRLEGIDESQIVEIVDHHKANINFNSPIYLNFKPWGSSASVVFYMMKYFAQTQVLPDKKLASLMLAAILSDTVGYKSSTTTSRDKSFGDELAKIAGISAVEAFTLEIFKAKSDISSLTDEQIVTNDYKVFQFGKKTLIDQLETVEQAEILKTKKDGLLKAMAKIKQEQKVELLFVAITDILKVNTKLLILTEEEKTVAEKAFGGRVENNVLDIGPKMSRKKDIAPAIEKALN